MKRLLKTDSMVQSPIGKKQLDSTSSAVGAARMNPENTFKRITDLLQDYINNNNERAWQEIKKITDDIYTTVTAAMDALEAEEPFSPVVLQDLKTDKKLLFKVNLVMLPHIDYQTHGLGIPGAATEWAFTAAVMRWFHDRLGITYHQMSVGEAGVTTGAGAEMMSQITGNHITREAIMEGKFPGGFGGWGFYFARKYLQECHDPAHTDDPMSGYQESLGGYNVPPGRVTDKLMLYDYNIVDEKNGREVTVAGGVNFKTITMHKVIVGGDPADAQDRRDWPGCFLINVPKMKVHVSENFTCAVKNIGMGFYSINVNESQEPGKYRWKYSAPNLEHPNFKLNVPHGRWLLETDPDTLIPVRDKNGDYIWKKTGGMQATMADAIQAVKGQGIKMLHVADLIEMVNYNNSGPEAVTIPEGFVLASADPVALDACAARYMFTMVPMADVKEIQRKYHLKSDVIQKIPMPELNGNDIVTGKGYDSSFSRYYALKYCEERGLGQRRFYVVGRDLWQGGRLVSLKQRLGRVEKGVFHELLTTTLYYAPRKILYDFQAAAFKYLELNDKLTGSDYKRQILELLDENRDGVIDYLERGKETSPVMLALQTSLMRQNIGPDILARLRFLLIATQMKLSHKEWNTGGHSFGGGFTLAQAISTALEMSQSKEEHSDLLCPGRQWGRGKWPSLQSVLRQMQFGRIYGAGFPGRIDASSPYGQAFYYADVKYNGGKYCTPVAIERRDVIARYFEDINKGFSPLPFTVYVPPGLGNYGNRAIPNVIETSDPALILTALFGGKEAWRELRLSEYDLK